MSAIEKFSVLLNIMLNILSVVGIVLVNKAVGSVDRFNFMVFLSFLHFVFTCICTRIMLSMNVFVYKDVNILDMLPVALGSLFSVGFMNLNLQANSVGIYQISKLACIPITLAIQYVFYNQTISTNIAWTLAPLSLGVYLATVYDVEANFTGTIFAICAVLATSLAQIFTSAKQKSLGCNALQLLYHTSPWIAAGMLIMSPMFDDIGLLMQYEFTVGSVSRIACSCALSLVVNVSNYVVLGRTSPLTYQVLGHVKTILILLLGFVLFNKQVDCRQATGIVIAMVGVIAYTELKRAPISKVVPPLQIVNDEDSSLLSSPKNKDMQV